MSSDQSTSNVLDNEPSSQWEACIRSIPRTATNPAQPSIPNPHFDYVPLDFPSHDIRLFSLFPADNFDDDITGGLFHASLNSLPTYETVSYVWGDSSICENIHLRYISSRSHPKYGSQAEAFQCVPVTTNLALLLRHLRHTIIPKFLWIDAICINQYSNDEKGHQVQLMATIYKFGARSTAWLGEERDGSTQALQLIDHCVKLAPTRITLLETDLVGSMANDAYDARKPFYLTRAESEYVSSLMDHREIWFRIWILQEIIFAPKPVLKCGPESLTWNALATFLRMLPNEESIFQTTAVQHALLMDDQRMSHHEQAWDELSSTPLLTLLDSTQSFRSSDERDRVYALLNITHNRLGITPDYNISASEMWISVFKVFIRSEGYLFPFPRPFQITPDKRRNQAEAVDFPSWLKFKADELPIKTLKLNEHECWDKELLNELTIATIPLDLAGNSPEDDITFHDMFHSTHGSNTKWNPENVLGLVFHRINYDGRQIPRWLWMVVERLMCAISQQGFHPNRNRSPGPRRLRKSEIQRIKNAYEAKTNCKSNGDCTYFSVPFDYLSVEDREAFRDLVNTFFSYRFKVTDKGAIVVLPPSVKPGDEVHMAFGSPVPLFLRPVSQTRGTFRIIGEGFVFLPDMDRSPRASSVMDVFFSGRGLEKPTRIKLV